MKRVETDFCHCFGRDYDRFGFPEGIQQVTAGHGAKVLSRPGTRKVMKELGEKARDKYEPGSSMEIITDLLTVDQIN
ncbi:MAG: hypothetical protein HFE75_16230 [Firmicutes bacterium]|nr:hypothetical protein [Bacillota bacterium]NBI62213.1 hypothetical protein [Clostridiales bacterium]